MKVDLRKNIEIKKIKEFSNINSFVEGMKLKRKFKEKFGMWLVNWDYSISDSECIDLLLQDMSSSSELYYMNYIDLHDGYFEIYKIKLKRNK